ncbi:MAG: Xaa-Pro peptidase family protein [Armatimonadota bacterium]|nr:Xaa-Pro peptidase family protein [Armatimonadota bacterium]MDR5703110.1 Xaa-Pro peptidase family protein [Armatimonadota bacterium]MDR7435562.1 Xaa-Pro peptidase family protein [Armatimonadota bacterium]
MTRLERLRKLMEEQGVPAMMVMKPENRTYVSGFDGTAGIALVTETEALLLVDFRYTEQATQQAPQFQVIQTSPQPYETLVQVVRERQIGRIGFEADYLPYGQVQKLAEALRPVELLPIESVDRIRWIKDQEEQARIARAVEIADSAFAHILQYLRPGVTEQEIAIELEYFMRRQGASKPAFDTIVASGPRSALPHGRASEKVLERGDLVTLDFGAVYRGYCSDCTRTIVLGKATEEQRKIYTIVLEAQERALEALRPGVKGKDVDGVARSCIAEKGYGEHFGHGLGHSVGLAIHETPTLSTRDENVLEPGMVLTVEPGIYLPGWGGVRIEDLAVVTEDGCRVLTKAPKTLLEL